MDKIRIILLSILIAVGVWLLMNTKIEEYANIALGETSHEGISFMQPMTSIKKIEKPGSYEKTPLWESDENIYSGEIKCRMANSHNEFNCFSEKTPYQCTINYGYSFDDDGYIACEECHYSPTNHRDCIRSGPVCSTCIENPRTIGITDIQQYVQACIGGKKN